MLTRKKLGLKVQIHVAYFYKEQRIYCIFKSMYQASIDLPPQIPQDDAELT